MATRAKDDEQPMPGDRVDGDHDAFVRAKVRKGLDQSSDRAAMIPIEQAWRDLTH